jgi:Putative adhesin
MRRLLLALTALALIAPPLRAEEEVFEKAFSMEGVSRVSLENVNGQVIALAWDKPYLRIHAVKTARGASASDTLRETEIRVRKVGDEIKIETAAPHRHRLFGFLELGNRSVRVDYELHVPAAVRTRVETCNGKVEAAGFAGEFSSDAVNGSIELRDLECPVKATTVNGSLRVAFRGPLKRSHLETVNGSVEVAFAKASSVRYDLETINGRIEADFDLAVEGKYGPKEAKGTYNGGSENLHCETVNGSIRLKTN